MLTTLPPMWLTLPFIGLLLMIATGPVVYPHFWEHYYATIAIGLSTLVATYYIAVLGDLVAPVEAFVDYVQFIALIAALYMAAGGILIEVHQKSTPWTNLALLWAGAILSNFVGTTGASMLLIRPYIRLNGKRIAPYHIVFFIFMVSNVGGVLTAVGDPPLLLGFLKGVPFFWTLTHASAAAWLVALLLLSILFYQLDRQNKTPSGITLQQEGIRIQGGFHFLLLGLIVSAVVVLDPKIFSSLPTFSYHGHQHSFVRELTMLLLAFVAYWKSDPQVLQKNGFSIEPLKEVLFIFLGIFGTMIPAIQLIEQWASSPSGMQLITPHFLYWVTGALSSVLDNAPTYLNFLAAGMSAQGLSIDKAEDVLAYAEKYISELTAISLGAVFFGAMSYVGNAPNLIVKAIAEELNVKMPSFFGYIRSFALPYLLSVLSVVWALFLGLPHLLA